MKEELEKTVDFQKLYARLVGHVDDAITCLERFTEQQNIDRLGLLRVKVMLQNALLEAEEQYINPIGE